MHGQHLKDIKEKSDLKNTWNLLRSGILTKETKGFILAVQEQALPTD